MKKNYAMPLHFLPVFLAAFFFATLTVTSSAYSMTEQEFDQKIGAARGRQEVNAAFEERIKDLPPGSEERLEMLRDFYLVCRNANDPSTGAVAERLVKEYPDHPRALTVYAAYLERKSKHEEALKVLHKAWEKSDTPEQQKRVINIALDHDFTAAEVVTGRYTEKAMDIRTFREKLELYKENKISRKEFQGICETYLSQHPKTDTSNDYGREEVLSPLLESYLADNNFSAAHATLDKMSTSKAYQGMDFISLSHVKIFKKEGKMDEAAAMLRKMAEESSDPVQKKEYLKEAQELSDK